MKEQNMTKIYSYVLRHDDGAAPNPFWGLCTLTICKPVIRRKAKEGDWVIGTGSTNSLLKNGKRYNFSNHLVYAMKITDKMPLSSYDLFCSKKYKKKIPKWFDKDWRLRLGDCIYDFSKGNIPIIRKGVHSELNRERDLSGINSLLSEHFYYFGEKPKLIPTVLREIIKINQGHKIIQQSELVKAFEIWIAKFDLNKLYADPQLGFLFGGEPTEDKIISCSKKHFKSDEEDNEIIVC